MSKRFRVDEKWIPGKLRGILIILLGSCENRRKKIFLEHRHGFLGLPPLASGEARTLQYVGAGENIPFLPSMINESYYYMLLL